VEEESPEQIWKDSIEELIRWCGHYQMASPHLMYVAPMGTAPLVTTSPNNPQNLTLFINHPVALEQPEQALCEIMSFIIKNDCRKKATPISPDSELAQAYQQFCDSYHIHPIPTLLRTSSPYTLAHLAADKSYENPSIILGPALMRYSTERILAVIAHEMGHLLAESSDEREADRIGVTLAGSSLPLHDVVSDSFECDVPVFHASDKNASRWKVIALMQQAAIQKRYELEPDRLDHILSIDPASAENRNHVAELILRRASNHAPLHATESIR
jgi:hypothetical protein